MNTAPIFTGTPRAQWIGGITAASTGVDLSTGTPYLAFTAGANGSLVRKIRIKAAPGQAAAATTFRIWLNTGGAVGTPANSTLIGEVGLVAAASSQVNANEDEEFVIEEAIPANHKIYVTIGTAPGGSGAWNATVFGGDY